MSYIQGTCASERVHATDSIGGWCKGYSQQGVSFGWRHGSRMGQGEV
ncbi:MAG TPA: hypothetical protein VJ695_06595 [Nitrososphaera sp.]|nr:hypothetical protein [Nitrososphaera sp.]